MTTKEASAAGYWKGYHQSIALLYDSHLAPAVFNDAHKFVAHDQWPLLRNKPIVDMKVRTTDCCSRHAEDDVLRVLDLRLFDFIDLHFSRLVKHDSFHSMKFALCK